MATCVLLFVALLGSTDSLPANRPNVIVILADDLGWTDLTCYGSDLMRTPNLDRLASRGVRFTDAYSACTVCSPTRAALLTGKYPARLHITDYIPGGKSPANAKMKIPNWRLFLPLDEVTLAERLKPLGYRTANIGKWHLGDDPKYWPKAQGFDVNVAGSGAGQPPSYFDPYVRNQPVHGNVGMPTLKPRKPGEYLTDRLTDEAIDFIEQSRNEPFFLYMPHHAVHTPLQAKADLVEEYRKRLRPGLRHHNPVYAAMVHSVDESVGRIVAKLDDLKLTDRTLVLFTSDNGGLVWKADATNNSPLRNGKGTEYEGGVRVPLIACGPGVASGGVCKEPVMSIDFVPTILELLGIRTETAAANWDGVSFAGQLREPEKPLGRKAIYWHYPHYHSAGGRPYGAIRSGNYRLIEHYEDGNLELFDLAKDIGETRNLASQMPEVTKQLLEKFVAWRERVGAQMPQVIKTRINEQSSL